MASPPSIIKEFVEPTRGCKFRCHFCTIPMLANGKVQKKRIQEIVELAKKVRTKHSFMKLLDNNIYNDVKEINYFDDSGHQLTINVYRARRADEPVGVVLMPVEASGYNGTIQLSIGILHDGTLFGVQVLTHQETEGLGGNIHQDKSNWLSIFSKQSFDTTPMERWAVKAESGAFDQLSGATITSRGVINTIKNSLKLYQSEQDTLFSH